MLALAYMPKYMLAYMRPYIGNICSNIRSYIGIYASIYFIVQCTRRICSQYHIWGHSLQKLQGKVGFSRCKTMTPPPFIVARLCNWTTCLKQHIVQHCPGGFDLLVPPVSHTCQNYKLRINTICLDWRCNSNLDSILFQFISIFLDVDISIEKFNSPLLDLTKSSIIFTL